MRATPCAFGLSRRAADHGFHAVIARIVGGHEASIALHGDFDKWNANLRFQTPNVESGVLELIVQAASVKAGSSIKESKLRSSDFFSAKEFPEITDAQREEVTQFLQELDPATLQPIGVAREMLLRAKEVAESRGFRMLHALVDSMWLQKPGAGIAARRSISRMIAGSCSRAVMSLFTLATISSGVCAGAAMPRCWSTRRVSTACRPLRSPRCLLPSLPDGRAIRCRPSARCRLDGNPS